MLDVLIIGAGPAGLSLAAGLVQAGVAVQGLSATPVDKPWPNTYGIWVDEMAALGLTDFLKHRWQDCVVYVDQRALDLNREYGLIDNDQLQAAWLAQTEQHKMLWHQAKATQIAHSATGSTVTTDTGQTLTARLVIDASGHHSPFIQRCSGAAVAYQAAYGIVGRFSQPPIGSGQMVLMDYRDDHLANAERAAPPTFLYAMDLGNDVYFVEETSLAHRPAIALDVLEKRLYQRLAQRQVTVTEVHHVERCLFPMNLPLPDLQQPVLGFGGAASLVHPASGYMMGAILRRGPAVVQAVIQALDIAEATPHQLAQAGWQALWSPERLRKNYLYRFGLENLMAWDGPQLQRFFATFFGLKLSHWSSFLADTLSLPELVGAMLVLFSQAPNGIRWDLMRSVFPHYGLLLPTFIPGQLRTHVPD
ncbi:MAG: lycopene cyclase family protein [Leptolyngbya sp. SIOISBB]|nr:lycopene cyclase family protein [Leptolyngbya sp. SIOISBB]